MHTILLNKISEILETTDDYYPTLLQILHRSFRVFLTGAGRSGLVAKFFAMRLMHAGLNVHIVGETSTPSIHKDDVLIVISSSGETETALAVAKRAKKAEAFIILISSKKESTIGNIADMSCQIGREELYLQLDSSMPMGTAFELSSLIFLEGMISKIIKAKGISELEMKSRHTNLE